MLQIKIHPLSLFAIGLMLVDAGSTVLLWYRPCVSYVLLYHEYGGYFFDENSVSRRAPRGPHGVHDCMSRWPPGTPTESPTVPQSPNPYSPISRPWHGAIEKSLRGLTMVAKGIDQLQSFRAQVVERDGRRERELDRWAFIYLNRRSTYKVLRICFAPVSYV